MTFILTPYHKSDYFSGLALALKRQPVATLKMACADAVWFLAGAFTN
ncbi:MAG: hypothetical protein PF694_14450 [Bacteroidetes bacterium]|jgi:hypothetical protein|nr:hypothetical protein [Bacteroidota bacterium]